MMKNCPFHSVNMKKSNGLNDEAEILLKHPKNIIGVSQDIQRIQCELKVRRKNPDTITNDIIQQNNTQNNTIMAGITEFHGTNKLVQCPGDHQRRTAMTAREQATLTPVQMCNPLAKRNLERVLTTLSQNTFTVLLSELSQCYVVKKELCHEITYKENQCEQVDKLVACLENCAEDQYKNFIELLKFKEETFALGCHMGSMYSFCCGENDLECPAAGETLQETVAAVRIEESRAKENLGVIRKDLPAFSRDVTKSEVAKAEEKCIELEIKVENSSDLEHLKMDVESGVFFKRYTAWMKKNGGTVAEGETMKFEVIREGEVVASFESSSSEHAADEAENRVVKRASALPKVTKLTEFSKKVMKHRLETHTEETAQAVALHNQTNKLNKFIEIQTEESISGLLTRLQQQDVLSSAEVTQLQEVLQNKDTDVFVSDLVSCLSSKTFEEVLKFVDVLKETHITIELGNHLKKVLQYCKAVSGEILELEEKHSVVRQLRRENQSLRRENQSLRKQNQSLMSEKQKLENTVKAVIHSRQQIDYTHLAPSPFKVHIQIDIGDNCRTMKITDNQLYCTGYKCLKLYSLTGELLSTVHFNYGGENGCSSVAVNSGQFIVADKHRGVFLLNKEGRSDKRLCEGEFSDICLYQGKVYALEYKQGKVVVFELIEEFWTKSQQITLSQYGVSDGIDKMYIKNNRIYRSSWDSDFVLTYDIQGQLLSRYGKCGRNERGDKAGLLSGPLLCDVDSSGTALIADCWNHRLQTCTSTGEWQVISLPQQVDWPCHAVVNNEDQSIWVLSDWKKLFKLTN